MWEQILNVVQPHRSYYALVKTLNVRTDALFAEFCQKADAAMVELGKR